MPCRITWFFVDRTSTISDGWTENFYSASNSSETALAQSTLPAFFAQRRAILSSDYSITKVRAVNVANRFDTSVKRYTNNQGRGNYAAGHPVDYLAEQPWDRLLVKLFAGTTTVRSFPLGGIPTGVIADTLDYAPAPAFRTAFDAWSESLAEPTTAYQIRHMTLNQTVPNPDTVTVSPDKRSLKLHWNAGQPGIGVNRSTIKLVGLQNATPVNGLWRIRQVSDNDWDLYPRRRTIYGTPTVPIQTQVMQFSFASITDSEALRGMERKTGRPSEQLRGRASVRQG